MQRFRRGRASSLKEHKGDQCNWGVVSEKMLGESEVGGLVVQPDFIGHSESFQCCFK